MMKKIFKTYVLFSEQTSHSTVKHRYQDRTSITNGNSLGNMHTLGLVTPPPFFNTRQVATYIFCFPPASLKVIGNPAPLRFLLLFTFTTKQMPYNPGLHFGNNQSLFFLTSTKAYPLLFFLVVPRVCKRLTLLYVIQFLKFLAVLSQCKPKNLRQFNHCANRSLFYNGTA